MGSGLKNGLGFNGFRDILELTVPEYIPMAVTTAFVGAVTTINALPDWRFVAAALSVAFVVGAFNSLNAVIDSGIDAINKPHRPLPSQRVTQGFAVRFSVLLYALALLLAYTLTLEFLAVTAVAVVLTVAYSLPGIYLKKRFVLGNLSVVILYTVLCFLAGWALYPDKPVPLTVMLALFFSGAGLSVLKDFEDVLGDLKHGVKSIPIAAGYSTAVAYSLFALLAGFLFIVYAIYQGILPTKYVLALLVFPLLAYNTNRLNSCHDKKIEKQVFKYTILLIILLEALIVVAALA